MFYIIFTTVITFLHLCYEIKESKKTKASKVSLSFKNLITTRAVLVHHYARLTRGALAVQCGMRCLSMAKYLTCRTQKKRFLFYACVQYFAIRFLNEIESYFKLWSQKYICLFSSHWLTYKNPRRTTVKTAILGAALWCSRWWPDTGHAAVNVLNNVSMLNVSKIKMLSDTVSANEPLKF